MPFAQLKEKYQDILSWVIGFAAFLWILSRSGINPKRFSYPCQRATLPIALNWLAAVIAFLTGSVFLRKMAKLSGPVLVAIGVAWFVFGTSEPTRSEQRTDITLPVWSVPDPISKVYVMDNIPYTSGSLAAGDASVPDESLVDPAMDTLILLMSEKGLQFYKTASVPDGIVGPADIVIIKANFMWDNRNTTNTDRIKGLIWRILQHPDDFTGEIIVCDNTQDTGTGINQMDNNSEDYSQSIIDVINTFQAKGYPVYLMNWFDFWDVVVTEYSDGDYADGYTYEYNTRVTYPKFQSPSGNHYISLRYGIWDASTEEYDHDKLCIINFPVLKTHSWAGASIALKNWMGVMTTAYAEERYNGWNYMHEWYVWERKALVQKIMAVTYPKLNIVDATFTSTADRNHGPWAETRMLAASTDPVAISWYTAKFMLTPVSLYPILTDPDNQYVYSIHLRIWSDTLRYSRGFPCTRDSSEIAVYNRYDVCGDFDGLEGINILDIVYLINYLYKDGAEPDPVSMSDVNSDGNLNILDIVYLINFIYKNGPSPVC